MKLSLIQNSLEELGNLEALTKIGGYYNNVINVRERDWDQNQYLWNDITQKYKK